MAAVISSRLPPTSRANCPVSCIRLATPALLAASWREIALTSWLDAEV
jgi:hypothetical protein